ncbi:aminotransferase class I/II-fold pyridoxal phosphate-dependent enzyme [Prescottella agglutinans]|uniref:Aminotransferase class I/II-fold pyridoxal phosphate-dependent enzyme n=1 Tax=Prescottella agglutinans TaxID=1644129 RepID=A0A438BFK1_9NOCA|nr:type I polyketide synthase [Prescottella agglutinans]RVW09806.1 aminotransferase class I/II-fold pyridoxal phosphate-dependent enzyme [Prescottella agglutinans]
MTAIAVVGIDCRFPQAPDPDALWTLLTAGADGVTEVPEQRWRADEIYDPTGGAGTVNNRTGGFVSDADAFDAEFFGIAPREAAAMDPQQRLLLQSAWRAFEDAAVDPRAQAGSDTGVFIGVMANEWAHLRVRDPRRITPQLAAGNGYFMTANRISYQLDLHGPSVAIDTACSSSLVAVHQACSALRDGECDQALAGGVNIALTPTLNIFYTQAGLSAPDGRCKPFSGNADGIGRGEGVAVAVLRRLDDAVAEGLPIHAVITGSAVNSDGRSNGITAPNRWAQQRVVEQAYRRAGVDPAQIDFLEAHGTGTVLGDMIETKALGQVHAVPRRRPCGIGSIKGNLGHTEGAAGMAGLIKVALSLRKRIVPPSRYADQENVRLRLADHGLALLAEPMELPAGTAHGAVSSFGIGGTNAHMVLATAPERPDAPGAPGSGVLTVSSSSREGLQRNALRVAEWIAERPADQLSQLCWSSNVIEASGRHRLAVPAGDRDSVVAALRDMSSDEQRFAAATGVAAPIGTGWLFAGQGSQYPGMGAALRGASTDFREALGEVDRRMAPHLGRSVRDLLSSSDIDRTEHAQPAIFAVEYALARALLAAGVEPGWLIGHSVGEYAAAALAEVMSVADACRLVVARGRLMRSLPADGAMLAVRASVDEVADLLDGEPRVSIAAVNGPRELVVSGETAVLERIEAALAGRGLRARRLAVSHAFHSPLMEPILDAFAEVAASCSFEAPRIPVYSTVRGRLLAVDEPMDADYWTEHIRATVRFADAVDAGLATEPTHLVEVGPTRVLGPLVARIRAGTTVLTPCPGPDATGRELADVVAALYRDGLDPNWDALYEPGQRVRRRLGGYAFDTTQRFWTTPADSEAEPAAVPAPAVTTTDPTGTPTMDNLIALFREQAAVLAAHLGTRPAAAPETSAPATPTSVPRAARPSAEPVADREAVAAAVRRETARVSGYPAEAVRSTQTLCGDLGFDSIMTTDLCAGLAAAFPGLAPDPAWFGPTGTVGALIDRIRGHLGADDPAPAPTTPAPPPVSAPADPVAAEPIPAENYRIDRFPEVQALADRLRGCEALGVTNPYFLTNDGVTRDTSVIDGQEVVNFSSYNYLGMSGHLAVVSAVQDAAARYGSSCSASRLLSGEKPVHRELEIELAELVGTEDALTLVSGHATNVTVIGHLLGPGDLVVHDSLAHDSILQGCKLSGATRRPFPHNDPVALDAILTDIRHLYRRVLIVVEGVYSQDGDIADLPAVIAVKQKHRALLMIDEAHSIGVLGERGGGIGEHFGVDRRDVDLWSGTMSKALAGCGGYVAGSRDLIRFLKYTTPGFVYSVGITPPNAAASLAAIRQLRAEPATLTRLRRNSELFLRSAIEAGIDTGDSHDTPVVPCIVGDSVRTLRLSNALLRRGINVNPILYPAVPEDLARLRFFVTSCHTEEQIRHAVRVTAEELALLRSEAVVA